MKMRLRLAFVCAAALLPAASAGAQTKLSGTLTCAKPDPQTALPVGDHDGHALVVMKSKCTWTKPLEVAGSQAKSGDDTTFSDVDGTRSRDSGYHLTTMTSGDTFEVRFSGTTVSTKDGKVQTQSGTWSFVRGTGKLKGITGKGTYKGTGGPDDSVISDIEGEYQLAGR